MSFLTDYSSPLLKPVTHTFYLLLMLATWWPMAVSAQGLNDVRKGVYGAKRQLMREVNRTKRDVNQVSQLLSSKKRLVDESTDTTDVIHWNMSSPYIPNGGMIHDYHYVYSFLHARQEYIFKKDADLKSIQWDSVNNQFYKNIGSGERLQDDVEVMGWHPYWMGDSYKYYPYKMLSIVSLYSYDINPNTGDASDPLILDTLLQSALLDSAKKYGTDVYVCVTSFGKLNNRKFLRDKQSREIFMTEILNILQKRKDVYAGVDLNFEEIDTADRAQFTDFVIELNARLSTAGYKVILDLPYYNANLLFDLSALRGHVHYFNVMGYDFNGEQSSLPGSISPYQALSTAPSLKTAVNDLLSAGIKGSEIILSLPLYGAVWDVSNTSNGGRASFEEFVPYYRIQAEFASQYNPFYDALSGSMYFLKDDDGSTYMCWYENDLSLNLKFQWIRQLRLKGVGLWALGYEQGDSAIWKAVENNFGAEMIPIEPIETRLSGPFGLAKSVVDHKEIIGLALLVFAGFLVLAFVGALTDWRVRDQLFKHQSFRVVYSMVFLVMAIVGSQWWFKAKPQWALAIGLLVGAIGVAGINFIFSIYRRQLR